MTPKAARVGALSGDGDALRRGVARMGFASTLCSMDASEIIATLGLQPHPEGGHYRETWRHEGGERRGAGTSIYYLLRAGERSHWHRFDAAEIWHFYAGSPLELRTYREGGSVCRSVLGPNLAAGERPQITVAPHEWQSASTLGDFTLAGCTVSPAFQFESFELAPEGWEPARDRRHER